MVDKIESPQTGCRVGMTIIHWHIAALVQQTPDAKVVTELTSLCESMGVHTLYAPHVALGNAAVVASGDLSDKIQIGPGVVMLKNSALPADGVLFAPQHKVYSPRAFMCTLRGCMIIIMRLGQLICIAHAGRESLFNRSDDPERQPSVVDAMIQALVSRGKQLGYGDVRNIRVSMHCSIRPADFAHDLADHRSARLAAWAGTLPENRCWYAREHRWLHLNLPEIGAHQCETAGIAKRNIDLSHAFLPQSYPTTRNGLGGRALVLVGMPT